MVTGGSGSTGDGSGSTGDLARLGLATLPATPAAARPSYDPRDLRVGLVHLGTGAFFRAHQAWYTHLVTAGGDPRWGILAVSQRSAAVTDRLAAQDGLYSLLERQTGGGLASTGPHTGLDAGLHVVGVVRQTACMAQDPEPVLDALADPGVHAVTLTVTEKGYRAQHGRLVIDGDVEADLASSGRSTGGRAGRAPVTVVGQLVHGLSRRAAAGAGPIAVISCDNLSDNGGLLRRLVHDFAGRLTGPDAATTQAFIEQHTTFPATMVDRIVPATTEADLADVARLLGLRDEAAVVTEPFRQWVIADDFRGPRPPWETAGATMTNDVAGYERVKLRLLNATHSLIAYLGSLAGYRTIAEAIRDPLIERAARALIDEDQLPTLTAPDGLDLAGYREQVLSRFANPALGHRTEQVAMDGSQKLPQRVLAAARERRSAGATPRMAALVVAGWLCFLTGHADDGRPLDVSDPLAGRLAPVVSRTAPPRDVVLDAMRAAGIFVDLVDDDVFTTAVTGWFTALRTHGVLPTLALLPR